MFVSIKQICSDIGLENDTVMLLVDKIGAKTLNKSDSVFID